MRLTEEIALYADKSNIFHYTNDGTHPYIRPEFNELICLKNIEQTPFILEVAEYSKMNRPEDILYIKGDFEEFIPYKIDEGAESIVVNNTPFSVLKVMSVSPALMVERNKVPTSMPCQIRGIFEHDENISYIYFQTKVKVVPKEELTFYLKKIDIEMMKQGFFLAIGYSDDVIRVYTDGFLVIDDIGYGNVGVGLDGKVHVIDCNVMDIDNWEEMNEANIANKVACISYNSKKYGINLYGQTKQVFDNVNTVIRKYERELDTYLAEHLIDFEYEHLKVEE